MELPRRDTQLCPERLRQNDFDVVHELLRRDPIAFIECPVEDRVADLVSRRVRYAQGLQIPISSGGEA